MTLELSRPLERLASDPAPCRAAVFLTYAFDPVFFEQHVLRTVLQLLTDPVEQAARFGEELLAALQQVPVAVFADAGVCQAGRRAPYDLVHVRDRVFHPKLAILLFDEVARLHVGSGNLTAAGYGGNVELFSTLELRYDRVDDRGLLREVDRELARMARDAPTGAGQLHLVRDELRRRLGSPRADDVVDATRWRLLSSAHGGPLLHQVFALVPVGASITRVGLLAPFWELDDADAMAGTDSILGALAEHLDPTVVIDVGVLWDNPPIERHAPPSAALEPDFGKLWAWQYEEDDKTVIEILTPTKLSGAQLHYVDARGASRRYDREVSETALREGRLWPAPDPIVFAPQAAIDAARAIFGDVRLWLHPAIQLEDDSPRRRPLHAKLVSITWLEAGRSKTLLAIGSPNASRTALLRTVGQGGNDEILIAFVVDGAVTLTDILPELVFAPPGTVQTRERLFPVGETPLGDAVESAIHDPARRELCVRWRDGSALRDWSLTYLGRELAVGTETPNGLLSIADFVLNPASCELVLASRDRSANVPILVTDLVALPLEPDGHAFDLRDLLLLMGRRIGREKLGEIRSPGRGDPDAVLDAVFGEGFEPTDVFRAWWNLADDLAQTDLPLRAFRVRLEGALGASAVWRRMVELARAGPDPGLAPTEAWFYGVELRRALAAINLGAGALADSKRERLRQFQAALTGDLETLSPAPDSGPWIAPILQFYREGTR